MVIINGKDKPLNFGGGSVPNVADALGSWAQSITFTKVVKTVVNFKEVETRSPIKFNGVWQPMTDKQLTLLPEGQRAWSWYQVHAPVGVVLDVDDIVIYQSIQFRVMSTKDYSLYGYVVYSLIEDYQEVTP